MSYVSISAQIVALLQTITELNQVYAYEPKELNKYPCATVSALSHKDEFNDTAANIRKFTFIIRIYTRTDSASDAESVMQNVVDKVMAKIESSVTLNGTCDFARPTEARWMYGEREVPVRICELTVEANKRVNR